MQDIPNMGIPGQLIPRISHQSHATETKQQIHNTDQSLPVVHQLTPQIALSISHLKKPLN